ncbi:hypothetical protein ACOZ4L_09305 [Haloplanus ruber]|uniref:Lasso RiPP family leader peptide-containing protein n=1 Tax=Haloplanus ruber TaxID=869892 RepID=A0ABD6CY85_9EURY|nr:hypothetical protein [Haloplanus ruber]
MTRKRTYQTPTVESYGAVGAVTENSQDKIGSAVDGFTDTNDPNPLDGDFVQDS